MPVDGRNFVDEALPVAVRQVQNGFERPVEVVGDEGYLLVQAVEGVAYDPPAGVVSSSNVLLQCGQVTVCALVPSELMRR